ncbi:hypothetical protein CL657_03735 [bacterium]|nr:hypothetical protein [bacterium]
MKLFIFLFILVLNLELYSNPIKIGSSVSLTGTSKDLGHNLIRGMNFVFDDVNQNGGINGRLIEFITLDDGYNPNNTVQNIISLIENHQVDILSSFTGTPTVQRILPLLIKYNKTLFFPFTGAQILVTPPYNNHVILLRPTYWQELQRIISYLKSHQKNNIAIFYQLDGYGMNGVSGIRTILNKDNNKPVIEISYIRGKSYSESFEKESSLLLSANPDAIICIASYEASAGIIRDIRSKNSDILIANISFSDKDSLRRLLINNSPNSFRNLLHTQVVPEFSDHPIIKTYLTKTNQFNSIEFEGYLNALNLIEILKYTKDTSDEYKKSFYTIQSQNLSFSNAINNHLFKDPYLIKSNNKNWQPIK